MTEFILVLSGLLFGAICLVAGYVIAKKKKIASEVQKVLAELKETN